MFFRFYVVLKLVGLSFSFQICQVIFPQYFSDVNGNKVKQSKVEQINYCFVFLDFLRKKVTSFSFDCLSFFLFESDKFLTNEVVISRLTAFVFSHLCSFVSLLVCSFVHLFLSISVLYYCYCYCCCVIIIWKTEGNLFFIKNECEYVFLGSVALF